MIVGIDEVGRGPIAGPVTVCAFTSVLAEDVLIALFPKNVLRDSKKLSEKQREGIYQKLLLLKEEGLASWALSSKSASMIDEIGISTCLKECVQEALSELRGEGKVQEKDMDIFLDGSLHAPKLYAKQQTVIKGDETIPVISCASIIAKTVRDTYMKELGAEFPGYGFENHVGYGTSFHFEALKKFGVTTFHRKTFLTKKPIK